MTAFAHDLFVAARSEVLQGLRITLCGGGGIAAIELPKVARELRRHGAQVRFFVTENCLRFVGREALEWASEQPVIVNPSGFAEHICHDDAVVIMPTTADLIGKIEHGICSDGVTTLVQSALGGNIPVILCPTMHGSLAASPIVQENRKSLAQKENIFFVAPRVEEGKEKVPPVNELVNEICHIVNRQRRYAQKQQPRMLVTYGGTRASLDAVRCLTNLSTGRLGQEIVRHAYRLGLDVTAVEGNVYAPLENMQRLNKQVLPEYADMCAYLEAVQPENYDAVFHVAAVSDFVPYKKEAGKISGSAEELVLKLGKSKKFLALPNLRKIGFQLACKLTSGSPAEGKQTAREFLHKNGLNVLLWNNASALSEDVHRGVVLMSMNGKIEECAVESKADIARCLLECFLRIRTN
jgi:phosphopantothenoylcysteine decarboxylase/phosphopantothenate--cysteine ligase